MHTHWTKNGNNFIQIKVFFSRRVRDMKMYIHILTMCMSRYICVYVYEKLHIWLAVRQNSGSEFPLTSSTTLVNENNMFQLCVCLIYFKIDPSWNFDIYITGITDYISSLISGAKPGTAGTWKSIIYRVGPKRLLLCEYNIRLIQFSFLMEK